MPRKRYEPLPRVIINKIYNNIIIYEDMKILKIAGYLYQIIKTRKKQQKIAKEWSDLKKSTDDARDLLRRVSSRSNETVM